MVFQHLDNWSIPYLVTLYENKFRGKIPKLPFMEIIMLIHFPNPNPEC